jgi:hypothetical protein
MRVATFTVVHIATRQTLTSGIGQDASVISYAHAMVQDSSATLKTCRKARKYRKNNMAFARICAPLQHICDTAQRLQGGHVHRRARCNKANSHIRYRTGRWCNQLRSRHGVGRNKALQLRAAVHAFTSGVGQELDDGGHAHHRVCYNEANSRDHSRYWPTLTPRCI